MSNDSFTDPLILLRKELEVDALRPFQVYGETVKWGLIRLVFPRTAEALFEYRERPVAYSPIDEDINDATRVAERSKTLLNEEDLALLFCISRQARDRLIVFVNHISKARTTRDHLNNVFGPDNIEGKIERHVYDVHFGGGCEAGVYRVSQHLQTDPHLRLNNCWFVEKYDNRTMYCKATEVRYM